MANACTPPCCAGEPLADNEPMRNDIIHNPAAHRFEIALGEALAVCEYRLDDSGGQRVLTLHHTEVPAALQGRGVAGDLVAAALAWARAEGLKVRPTCSYVAAYMQRHPDTADLLAG